MANLTKAGFTPNFQMLSRLVNLQLDLISRDPELFWFLHERMGSTLATALVAEAEKEPAFEAEKEVEKKALQ